MKQIVSLLSLLCLLFCETALTQTKKPLTNDQIIQMSKSGFGDQTIVKTIKANETAFDTSVDALLALKNEGVTQPVIEAMLESEALPRGNATVPTAAPAKAGTNAWPEEVGVYINVKGNLTMMEPEIVAWRTGGVLKKKLTMGVTHGHVNGTVKNHQSSLRVTNPLEFVIRCPEGVSAGEYQLLQLDQHGDRREFRAITGGIIHASGGSEKNAAAFDYEKVAPRVYRIKVASLKKGEYGFLPPGAEFSKSATSMGKIYSFGVAE